LTATFRRYGLPERMLMDNGSPWGGAVDHGYTPLTVWLLRLGVAVSHSRPFPEQLPAFDYDLLDQVRKVQATGKISFAGRHFRIGRPFQGYPVALRPT